VLEKAMPGLKILAVVGNCGESGGLGVGQKLDRD